MYEAEHVRTGARVALKLVRGDGERGHGLSRLREEARLLSAARGEHVVRMLEDATEARAGVTPFLAMELLEGRSLEEEARTPLAAHKVLAICTQLAYALDALHVRGIVHCDLKPDNIFVSTDAAGALRVTLLDFGIARRIRGTQVAACDAEVPRLGTPSYMAPEQALGVSSHVDARTDLWALGVIAFRLLAGRPYHPVEPAARTILRVAFTSMPAPSALGCAVSSTFDAWFLRACSRAPAARFSSARAQVQALAEALRGVTRARVKQEGVLQTGPTLPLDAGAAPDSDEHTAVRARRALRSAHRAGDLGHAPTVPLMQPMRALVHGGAAGRGRRMVGQHVGPA